MKQRLIKEIKKKIKKKNIIFFFGLILISSFISAAVIGEDLHLNIQTTDETGAVVTGTFAFAFNISNSSDCNVSNVVYNKSITLTTDSRGIISYYLPNVTLDYDVQYWLCYYRDGVLVNSSKMARSPYTFRARNITLSGVEVDKNFDLGSYNVSADSADFGGGWLSDGVSIIGGGIYAQVGYFYNITSLNVTKQNLTIIDDFYALGNVGIGTTSPSQKLHVEGDTNITGNLTLGQKITFSLGEIIDNIVDGWVRITGNVNITGNLSLTGVANFKDVMNLQPKNESPGNGSLGDLFVFNSSSSTELCFFNGVRWKGLITGGSCGADYCDSGWILVPGDATFGTSDFCVMKYEAKNVGGVATSQIASAPWVSITQINSIGECSDIGAHLCLDEEAQTINRNIEQVISNWNDDTIGGCMYGGHMDNNPANALAASTDDAPYYGTGDSSGDTFECPFDTTVGGSDGKEQRRTFSLSTGDVIWDWSGNVWEWLYGDGASGTIGTTGGVSWRTTAAWTEWSIADLNEERAVLGASNSGWDSANGIGKYYGGVSTNAFVRGGSWGSGASAGVFAAYLGYAPSSSHTGIGFRCCKSPNV